ncbi:Nop52-domain-containing protein [Microstroma glucosiphilum]|uniref:Nop52-domain-containing protein n=1 Tax=Pseudomicrostroma glucosiphilum TaxID=1684307 RepID=A0A316UD66_9BASI|nr:Nop52-domain-containing protein [Pseudomicrostroma glucosiphilum]PWN22351.1 Nop52-domain-containing protein [Pseudomicrostroma glucosiphilum]
MASTKAQSTKAAGKRAANGTQPEPEAAIPMGKLLASTEKKTRDSAIKSLSLFLAKSGEEPIPPLEMAKLWKGIFYCFWMSDKPLVQQALAQELSDLLLSIPGSSKVPAAVEGVHSEDAEGMSARAKGGLALLEGFWTAMGREWSGLDKWRIDKFYLLLRRFVNAAFRLLASEDWNEAAVARFAALTVKTGGPLCANDVQVPAGLTYHMTDVYLDELEKALVWAESQADSSSTSSEAARAPILNLLKPMLDTASTCHSSTVFDKVQSNVLEPLWEDCLAADAQSAERAAKRRRKNGRMVQPTEAEAEQDEGDVVYPAILRSSGMTPLKLRQSIFKDLFESASREEAVPSRRRKIYALWQQEKERRENAGEDDEEEED